MCLDITYIFKYVCVYTHLKSVFRVCLWNYDQESENFCPVSVAPSWSINL